MYKLGAKAPTFDKRDLLFADYFESIKKLPPIPRTFGHESLVERWNMLANDSVGDCVFAGAAHESMLLATEGGAPTPPFDDDGVLGDYSAVTGYVPGQPDTDQGTDVRAALNYRRTVGVIDAHGVRHKIGAYVALEPGNVEQLEAAMRLFGCAAIALDMPQSAMDQFEHGQPWSVVAGSNSVGGHYVPGVAVRNAAGLLGRIGLNRMIEVVSWARVQPMTMGFYEKRNVQTFAILSTEMIGRDGKSLEGFDLAALQGDLADLGGGAEVAA